ncbi:MAG: CHAT domain-containing protein [Crocinitomicaceae bacterium]|jgi:hypothetical protein
MFSKTYFLAVSFLFLFFLAFSRERVNSSLNQDELIRIENLIANGKPNTALYQISKLLGNKRIQLSKNNRYQLLVNESKIHFLKENMSEFLETAEKSFSLKRGESEIYEAYFCSQKAAYFHYFILGDSAIIYADRALKLLHNDWGNRSKVPCHFIYQIYATAFTYKNVAAEDKSYLSQSQKRINNYLCYYDSSLIVLKHTSYFPQEKALIYRSMANRMLDFVGYQYRHSKADFNHYYFQLKMAKKALSFYDIALSCLPKNENQLRISLLSLKALTYYMINEGKKADDLIFPYVETFHKYPIEKTAFRMKESLYLLEYFTLNLISKKEYDARIEMVLDIYKQIKPFWRTYSSVYSKRVKDSYGSSPSTMILLIDNWLKTLGRFRKSSDQITVNNVLENYLYFSKSYSKLSSPKIKFKFLEYLSKLENKSINKYNSKFVATFSKDENNSIIDLKKIQKKLERDDAIVLQSNSVTSREYFVLITKKEVYTDTVEHIFNKYPDLINERNLNEFKRKSYENYRFLPFYKLLLQYSINKLYVAGDIMDNLDCVIMDTIGKSFDDLIYLKKRINIVKIYNPIDFLESKTGSGEIDPKCLNLKLISEKDRGKLPFSENLFSENKRIGVFGSNDLSNPGILHLIGHGKLNDKLFFWKSNKSELLNANDLIKKDLFILNQCFGSYQRITYYPDRDLQNNLISRGTKAVIASPYETVDQSSAWIFKKFYSYLNKGIIVEDALHKAKLDYLRCHKGTLAHPIYWSTYELTTNVRHLKLKLESDEKSDFSKRILLVSSILFLLLVISFFIFKLFRKSPLN